MLIEEFVRIHQRPAEILERNCRIALPCKMLESNGPFGVGRLAAIGGQIKFLDDCFRGLLRSHGRGNSVVGAF